jgi:hypothetical protein
MRVAILAKSLAIDKTKFKKWQQKRNAKSFPVAIL